MANLTSKDGGSHSAPSANLLQRFFLLRLQRMVAVRRERAPFPDVEERDLRLLDRSVYSTFCDCLDLGVAEEARAILYGEDDGPLSDRNE